MMMLRPTRLFIMFLISTLLGGVSAAAPGVNAAPISGLSEAIDLPAVNCQVADIDRSNGVPYGIKGERDHPPSEYDRFGPIVDYYQISIGESSLAYTTAICTVIVTAHFEGAHALFDHLCQTYQQSDQLLVPAYVTADEACEESNSGIPSLVFRMGRTVFLIREDTFGPDIETFTRAVLGRLTAVYESNPDCESGFGSLLSDACWECHAERIHQGRKDKENEEMPPFQALYHFYLPITGRIC